MFQHIIIPKVPWLYEPLLLLVCMSIEISRRNLLVLVGMGFRPQPVIQDSLIRITNNPDQQKRIASSLRLYRDG